MQINLADAHIKAAFELLNKHFVFGKASLDSRIVASMMRYREGSNEYITQLIAGDIAKVAMAFAQVAYNFYRENPPTDTSVPVMDWFKNVLSPACTELEQKIVSELTNIICQNIEEGPFQSSRSYMAMASYLRENLAIKAMDEIEKANGAAMDYLSGAPDFNSTDFYLMLHSNDRQAAHIKILQGLNLQNTITF